MLMSNVEVIHQFNQVFMSLVPRVNMFKNRIDNYLVRAGYT